MLLLGLLELPSWLVLSITVIVLFYFYTARKHSLFKRYGIPSIKPMPFIGGFPHLIKKGMMQSEYDATIQYGRCVGFFLGNMPTVFVTEPEIIREVYVKRFTEFPNRSQAAYTTKFWETTILSTTDIDNWRFLRSTLTPSFSSGKLRKMDTIVINCINHAIERLKKEESGAVIDMVPLFQGITLDVICQSAMGVKLDADSDTSSNNELREQISGLLNFSLEKNPYLLLLFIVPDLKKLMAIFDIDFNNTKAIAYLKKCMDSIVQERKQNKSAKDIQDILQLMINTNLECQKRNRVDSTKDEDSGKGKDENVVSELEKPSRGMTDEEITANAIMFLFAGYDTTSTAMIFTSYFLATQQEYQEKIVREIDEKIGTSDPDYDSIQQLTYLDMFVSESMRLYPPVTRVTRNNDRDTQIGQYTFPQGISIAVPVFTLHRLPEFWPDPEKFDPERFSVENKPKLVPYTYLPFGTGPRNCVGMRFANMEIKMTLVKLLQNFTIRPSHELKIPPKLEKHVFCRPVGGMKLVLEKRN